MRRGSASPTAPTLTATVSSTTTCAFLNRNCEAPSALFQVHPLCFGEAAHLQQRASRAHAVTELLRCRQRPALRGRIVPILQIQFHAKGPGGNVAVVNASMYQVTAAVASPQFRAGRSRSLCIQLLGQSCRYSLLSHSLVPMCGRAEDLGLTLLCGTVPGLG